MIHSIAGQQRPTAADQHVDVVASQSRTITLLTMLSLAALVVMLIAVVSFYSASRAFVLEDRVRYVKLTPDGAWTVTEDLDRDVLYYSATLNHVLFQFVARRYSENPITIAEDWGVAASMYAPDRANWFLHEFGATAKAEEYLACRSCPIIRTRARALQHLDPLPDQPGRTDSDVVRTMIYADREERDRGGQSVRKTTRMIYQVSWRMLAKHQIQANPQMLTYNPIGVQIVDVAESVDETQP